jgi:hypothetical protein
METFARATLLGEASPSETQQSIEPRIKLLHLFFVLICGTMSILMWIALPSIINGGGCVLIWDGKLSPNFFWLDLKAHINPCKMVFGRENGDDQGRIIMGY